MYIATAEPKRAYGEIISIFPPEIKRCLFSINLQEAQEIRIILGQPLIIHYCDGDYFISKKGVLSMTSSNCVAINKKDIEYITERISLSSLYSVKDELKKGYITISGGHRIGIVGTAVLTNNEVEFIKDISAMTVRIANEVVGCGQKLAKKIMEDGLKNALIISPPACGKTTLLRDIIREISEAGYYVGVADERCEVAGMYKGISGFNIGPKTFVMEGCQKAYAMECLLSTMAPDVIATDELGQDEDIKALYNAINSGVGVIATAHGRDKEQLLKKDVFKTLIPLFDIIITLSRKKGVGTVENVEC